MMCIPCGTVLAALVFKANCQEGLPWNLCLTGWPLIGVCTGFFLLHVVIHTLVLQHVVPKFGRPEAPPSKIPYNECAKQFPCSWFSANPVHCLRSKYVYKHYPPCDFHMLGKEHLLRVN